MTRINSLLIFVLLNFATIWGPNITWGDELVSDDNVVKLYLEHKGICERQTACRTHALIFIHGIMGSKDTWKNQNSYWPKLIAEDSTTNAFDIYRIDYETGILSGARIYEIIRSLTEAMDHAEAMQQYKTIQFIAHSLGGIVVRNYLLGLKTYRGHWALDQFRQVILIGSPGEGSYLAKVASIVNHNPQLRVLRPLHENDYLELLNYNWDGIQDKRWMRCPPIFVRVGYELLPVPGIGIVVTGQSAENSVHALRQSHLHDTDGSLHEVLWQSKGFERNHINIVKPLDSNDPVYKWVNEAIVDCASGRSIYICGEEPQEPDPFCKKPRSRQPK